MNQAGNVVNAYTREVGTGLEWLAVDAGGGRWMRSREDIQLECGWSSPRPWLDVGEEVREALIVPGHAGAFRMETHVAT